MTRQLGSAYELDERIGRGAMGEVWRGRVIGTGEPIAAKLLHDEHTADQEVISRFVQERSILVSLDHPNLVRVRDLVAEGASLAIVMDLVQGSDLRTHLRNRGQLAPAEAVELTVQVLAALEAAHAGRVLHRDVKPENVLLDLTGGAPQVRLSDFGISRLTEGTAVKMSQLIGTAEYLAPETIAAEVVSPAADVYATGIMLYELLAGRTPFVGKGQSYAIVRRQVDAAPPKLDALPPQLWAVIAQLLAKDPAARPDARAARALLEGVAPSLVGLPPIPPPVATEEWEQVDQTRYTSSATELRGLERPDDLELAPTPAWAAPVREGGDDGGTTVVDRPVVRMPQPVVEPFEDDDEPDEQARRRRNAVYVGLGVLGVGVVVALLLLVGGGSDKKGSGGSGAAGPSGAHASGKQTIDNDILTLDRQLELEQADDGTYTLRAKLEYRAGADGISGPVVEVVPPSVLALTDQEVVWSSDDGPLNPPRTSYVQATAKGQAVSYELELPKLTKRESATFTYELAGLVLDDAADRDAQTRLLEAAAAEVDEQLSRVLRGAGPLNRNLWLLALTSDLRIDVAALRPAVPVRWNVFAQLQSGDAVQLYGQQGAIEGPSDLLTMLGGAGEADFAANSDDGGDNCRIVDRNLIEGKATGGRCVMRVVIAGLEGDSPPVIAEQR